MQPARRFRRPQAQQHRQRDHQFDQRHHHGEHQHHQRQFPQPLLFQRARPSDQGAEPILFAQPDFDERCGHGHHVEQQPGRAAGQRLVQRVGPFTPQHAITARAARIGAGGQPRQIAEMPTIRAFPQPGQSMTVGGWSGHSRVYTPNHPVCSAGPIVSRVGWQGRPHGPSAPDPGPIKRRPPSPQRLGFIPCRRPPVRAGFGRRRSGKPGLIRHHHPHPILIGRIVRGNAPFAARPQHPRQFPARWPGCTKRRLAWRAFGQGSGNNKNSRSIDASGNCRSRMRASSAQIRKLSGRSPVASRAIRHQPAQQRT